MAEFEKNITGRVVQKYACFMNTNRPDFDK